MSWPEVALLSLAAFVGTVVVTRPLIGFLRDRQLGKVIRTDGPAHQAKAGTPTMGGLGVLVVVAIAALYVYARQDVYREFTDLSGLTHGRYGGPGFVGLVLVPLVTMAAYATLGAIDDWQGLARKGRARELGVGLTARRMIVAQLAIAAVLAAPFLFRTYSPYGIGAWDSYEPGRTAVVGLIAVLAIAGTVNGVNMADGLDGLAAGLLAIAFGGLAAAATVFGGLPTHFVTGAPVAPPVAALALPTAAACLGFLVFNRHPARVFMGNVTSMGLGGLLAVLFLVSDVWYLLPVIGAVFVVEVVSDIIQVGYFKYSGGRRVFRMAPIHHHFELGGWPETKVVTRFWLCGLVAALAGVALAAVLART